MTDKAFAQADPDWLALISAAREWLSGPLGQFLLDEERRMLCLLYTSPSPRDS